MMIPRLDETADQACSFNSLGRRWPAWQSRWPRRSRGGPIEFTLT